MAWATFNHVHKISAIFFSTVKFRCPLKYILEWIDLPCKEYIRNLRLVRTQEFKGVES